MQRFPPQHMESREQRLRILRQGRQTPRASLQKSSPPQSSSTAQTPASCVGGGGGWKRYYYFLLSVQLFQIASCAPRQSCVHAWGTNYLQGVSRSVSRAARGGGARARADSVGASASEDPRQVLDGVGVHRDGPRVNYFPQVSKEREVRKQRALQ